MTDKRDYIIEITARKDPLACFKMIEEQVGKGFSPAFGEKMLTHTNNPKIISMLAERTAAALAQGGDFAAYEALVFDIVAGREINDDTRGKLQEAAAAHGRKADFDYIDGLPKFIDRDGRRSNLFDAWHMGERADLAGRDFTGYTGIGFAPEVREINLSQAKNLPSAALDFSGCRNLRSLSLRGADVRRTDKVKFPEGLEELDLCRNMRLAGDLSGQKKLKKLVLEGENLIENRISLPESLEELHCSETAGILAITGNLADCTKLKKLSLIGCDLRGCGLSRLSESVEELDLSFSYNMSRFMTDLSAYKNLKKVTFNGTDFAAGDLKLPEGCAAVINGRAAVGAMSGIETAEAVRTDKVVKAGRSEKAAPERSKVLRGMIAGKRAMMSRNRA